MSESATESPPHPHSRLVNGRWLVKSGGRLFTARPAKDWGVNGDGKQIMVPAGRDLHAIVDQGAILEPLDALCDNPGRLEAAFAGRRMFDVALHEPSEIDAEIAKLQELGLPNVAKLIRGKVPAKRERFGNLDLGSVYRTPTLHRLGVNTEVLRGFLERHANGRHGEIGDLEDAALDDDMRWAPGVFPALVQNAASIERRFGLVRSSYANPNRPDPAWSDGDRLLIATVIHGDDRRTYAYSSRYCDVSI